MLISLYSYNLGRQYASKYVSITDKVFNAQLFLSVTPDPSIETEKNLYEYQYRVCRNSLFCFTTSPQRSSKCGIYTYKYGLNALDFNNISIIGLFYETKLCVYINAS